VELNLDMRLPVSAPINLMGLDRQTMEEYFVGLGSKAFHGRNVLKWIHKHGLTDFSEMTDLGKAVRAELGRIAEICAPRIAVERPSSDGTVKWVVELDCRNRVETVWIPDGDRITLCVSSQVGCALDCSFCSTAQQGFNRNLSTAEIIGQVWMAVRRKQQFPTNIVLMGMGEPLANFDAVVAAMSIMQDDLAYMVSKYRVTVSTSGIVPAIRRLREVSDVSLAVSLHAPDNDLRNELVPINRRYPLEELIPACRDFIIGDRRRKVTFEYVMLDGVNDSDHHARRLIKRLSTVPSKVNLIPFNPFPGTAYKCTPPDRLEAFRQILLRAGILATTRKTRGDDIDAACGQLVGRVADRSRRTLGRPSPNTSEVSP